MAPMIMVTLPTVSSLFSTCGCFLRDGRSSSGDLPPFSLACGCLLSANGCLHTRLGLHLLNTVQRGTRTTTKVGWAGPNGPTGLSLFWAVRARSSPHGSSWHFALGPLHLCHFEVIITAIKLRDLYGWTSGLFISVLRGSPFKHIGPCHLWGQVRIWSELLDCLTKRSLN
jgi:hypothetical protein